MALKKILFVIGITAVILFFAAWLLLPELVWDGAANVHIELQLLDQYRGRPVKDAKILFLRPSDLRFLGDTNIALPFVVTDSLGRTKNFLICGAGGGTFLLWRTGGYRVLHEVIIEAPGYRPLTTPLANLLGQPRWPMRKKHHQLIIWMTPSEP